jgi:beta-glucanase (GH16 family)
MQTIWVPPTVVIVVAPVSPLGQDPSLFFTTFQDEFDAPALDTSKWNDHRWNDAVSANPDYDVSNSALRIWPTAAKQGIEYERMITTGGGTPFPSLSKFNQAYGFFECRMRLNVGKGNMVMFQLMNSDAPNSGEPSMNMLEAYTSDAGLYWANASQHAIGLNNQYFQNGDPVATWGGTAAAQPIFPGDLSAAMHVFGVKWTPNDLTFYFDGVQSFFTTAVMAKAMYMQLGLRSHSPSPSGYTDATTPMGSSNAILVDYVRAWQFVSIPPYVPPVVTGVNPVGQNAALYTLAFQDEFNGSSLDLTKWNLRHNYGTYNADPATYQVSNGSLKIFPIASKVGIEWESSFTTGWKQSDAAQNKFFIQYGYIEYSAKMPRGHGMFPAFWLLNVDTDSSTSGSPEIDIMECYGYWPNPDGSAYGADNTTGEPWAYEATCFVNGANYSPGLTVDIWPVQMNPAIDISRSFNVYGCKRTANQIQWFFNGALVATQNVSMIRPAYIALDLKSYNWGASGLIDNTTPLGISNSHEIQYVRAWTFA